jgi:DnaK suppressor protein
MDSKTLDHFKQLFIEIKRNGALENLGREMDETLSLKAGDEIDESTRDRENQLIRKLQGRQRFFLKKVDHALDKITNGTFGECSDCGDDISTTRLMARPTATLCICCKEEQERGEGHVLYEKKSHTHGKQILNLTSNPSLMAANPGDDNIISFKKLKSLGANSINQTFG